MPPFRWLWCGWGSKLLKMTWISRKQVSNLWKFAPGLMLSKHNCHNQSMKSANDRIQKKYTVIEIVWICIQICLLPLSKFSPIISEPYKNSTNTHISHQLSTKLQQQTAFNYKTLQLQTICGQTSVIQPNSLKSQKAFLSSLTTA